jgi:hypothetical protein
MTKCAMGIMVMTAINFLHFLLFEIIMTIISFQHREFFYGVPFLYVTCDSTKVRSDCKNCGDIILNIILLI